MVKSKSYNRYLYFNLREEKYINLFRSNEVIYDKVGFILWNKVFLLDLFVLFWAFHPSNFHVDVKASSTFSRTRNGHLYQGSANQTYTCEAETKLVLNITGGKGSITVDFRDLKIQPFPVNGSKFPNRK